MKKIAIITVSYNSEATIARTLTSASRLIDNSQMGGIAHIIVDGASKDGTLELIKRHKHPTANYISEKDSGIYDAMNKGLRLADAEYIWYLNSDDYIDDDFIESIDSFLSLVEKKSPDFIVGKIKMFENDLRGLRIKREWNLPNHANKTIPFGWHPPHPAFIAKKSEILKVGGFDLTKKIAADFKLMMAVIKNNKNPIFFDCNMVMMQCGGESNGSVRNILKANQECFYALKDLGFGSAYSLCFIMKKIINKLTQSLKGMV